MHSFSHGAVDGTQDSVRPQVFFKKKIGNEALGSQLVVEFRLVVQLVLLMNTKIPNDCLVLVYASLSNAHL